MDIITFLGILRRWYLHIIMMIAIIGTLSYFVRSGQSDNYEAQTTILIGGILQSPNPGTADIRTGFDLAQTYATLVKTRNVLQGTIDELNLPFGTGTVKDMVETEVVPNSPILLVKVEYTDPEVTAAIANELAAQLILNSPTNITPDQESQIELAKAQIEIMREQLDASSEQLDAVTADLLNAEDPLEEGRLRNERIIIIAQMNDSASTIADFTSIIANLQQRSNSLHVVEEAQAPNNSTNPGLIRTALIDVTVGAILVIGAAIGLTLLSESLNDRFRTSDEAFLILQLPILGIVGRWRRRIGKAKPLIVYQPPTSPIVECYRALRARLMLYDSENIQKTYVITSPNYRDGKSVTTANLAISMAQAGQRVLVVDANMRKPTLHELFGLENAFGFADLVANVLPTKNGHSSRFSDIDGGRNDFVPALPEGTSLTQVEQEVQILIVEDSFETQRLLSTQLARFGFDTTCVSDGVSALDWIAQNHVDLVILDIMLPDVDGLELCHQIREERPASDLPILMLSALGSESTMRIKGLAKGANDFIAKPYDLDELEARIRTHLSIKLDQTRPKTASNTNLETPINAEYLDAIKEHIQETEVPYLSVLTSGLVAQYSSKSLDSGAVNYLVRLLQEIEELDAILIDTPPCLEVTESLALSAANDTCTLLVVGARKTSHSAALKAKEQLSRIGAEIKGIIVNYADLREESY